MTVVATGTGSGGGVGEERLGMERVLRSLRIGGERVPSLTKGFDDTETGGAPFLKNEWTLIRGRRTILCGGCVGRGGGGCADEEATGWTPTDFERAARVTAGTSLSSIDAAGADKSRALDH